MRFRPFLVSAIFLAGAARGDAVKVYDFEPDVVDAERPPAAPPGGEAEAWGHLRKGEHAAAQRAYAAAVAHASDPAKREELVVAWIDAAVLAGTEPARVDAGLAAFHPTAEERAKWQERAIERYERFGDLARARAARAALARQAHGAAAVKLHLAAAADARRELDWRALDAELDAALAAAGDDAGERDEVAKVILDDATELQSTFQTSRDRAVGNAAKALYARYLAIPGHGEGQPRDLAKKLDETMAVDDPSGRGPHTVVEGTLDKGTLRRIIRAHLGEVSGCYQRALVGDEGVAGKVTLQLAIAHGAVKEAAIKDATGPLAPVAACITARAKKWRFPTARGTTVQLSYPLELRAAAR